MHRTVITAAAITAAVTLSACGAPATYDGDPAVAVQDAATTTAAVLEGPHAIDVTFAVDEDRIDELTDAPIADGADAMFGQDMTVRTTIDPGVGVALGLARDGVGLVELRHFIATPAELHVRASGSDLRDLITAVGADDDRAAPAIANLLTVFSDLLGGEWVTVTDVPPGTVDIAGASAMLSGTSDAVLTALTSAGSNHRFDGRDARGDRFVVDLPAEAFPPDTAAHNDVPVTVWVADGTVTAVGLDYAGFLAESEGRTGIVELVAVVGPVPSLSLPDSTDRISGRDLVARLFGAPSGAST